MKKPIFTLLLIACGIAPAQRLQNAQNDPNLAYMVPAGVQRGTGSTVIVGGQYLENTDSVYISGDGVSATVVGFDRPLSLGEVVRMRNRMDEVREEMGLENQPRPGRRDMTEILKKTGITMEEAMKMREFGRMRRDPMVQENAPVAEKVSVQIEVAPDAEPGRRELRVFRDGRISNPVVFYVGDYPELTEENKASVARILPTVLNGQVMPGETDKWKFAASKGDPLVVATAARELIPHLADAVPGWFQAVIALYDADGNELAYADDYLFNPDPILYYEIPADGIYTLAVRDAIYRGREDFVYRITVGEIPLVTSVFPLGGKKGGQTAVQLEGRNLPETQIIVGDQSRIDSLAGIPVACPVPFDHSGFPELTEVEPNNFQAQAMPIAPDCVVNGRIAAPGDRDVFKVTLRKGEDLLAEVKARRLNSPLDSVLMITDESGTQLAFSNDWEDRAQGRITHHADARILFEAPQNGTYSIHLGDIQNSGGPGFSYRLLLGAPEPDYELRMAPSRLNGVPGSSVPFTVYALRKDGFDGEIELKLKNQLEGLRLDGGLIPAGRDRIELTLTLPEEPLELPVPLSIEGRAQISYRRVERMAVPAEDMMQAFIYHHLVPVEELLVSNIENRRVRRQMQAECLESRAVSLSRGSRSKVAFRAFTDYEQLQVSYHVEPRNLPKGVSIQEVTADRGIVEIVLAADETAEKGLEGNLLFSQFIELERSSRNDNGPASVRIEIGSLPAAPFRIR